ncbi:hypothetical protein THAOC_32349 [Thalassiosira oceanica]|uniref:Uncharacterized protein n=1 Tax=Thalassiosira oceanica TaxID=159749 RepID=K0RIT5_THAOC|nr:hypothetical protein THAOC_32349 [Thalassiosira oceanica]|eukprot:EJK48821.1 hypothetical protein THAOC_32349 [Thalassiosira oceanica]
MSSTPRDSSWKAEESQLQQRRIVKARIPRRGTPSQPTGYPSNVKHEIQNRRKVKAKRPPTSETTTMDQHASEEEAKFDMPPRRTQAFRDDNSQSTITETSQNLIQIKATKQGDCKVRLETKEGDGDLNLTFDYDVSHVKKIEKLNKRNNQRDLLSRESETVGFMSVLHTAYEPGKTAAAVRCVVALHADQENVKFNCLLAQSLAIKRNLVEPHA